MNETIHSLRRQAFPRSAKSALHQLEAIYGQGGTIPGLGEEAHDQIVEEFIFLQPPQEKSENGISKKISSVQELQLLDVVLQYFKSQNNEWARNAIFRALFGVSSLPMHRLSFLKKFISMGVGLGCANILDPAAAWMQIQGCGCDTVTSVIKVLVDDYCLLVSGTEGVLRTLPEISPHFTCNFITAITHIYQPIAHKNYQAVPDQLLTLLTAWITHSPQLCLHSLQHGQNAFLQPQRTNLWTSPTKPNTQTPVPGLVRWCTKAPLLSCLYAENSVKNDSKDMQTPTMWSQLHLAVLECILCFSNIPGVSQLELITIVDMNRIVRSVSILIKHVSNKHSDSPAIDTATDRLVQVVQVSLATGGFRCSLADLRSIFDAIPSSRLLEILSSQHLSTAPPQMHNASQ